MQQRYHVPLDRRSHAVALGSKPRDLAVGHVEGEDLGVTFWAEPGEQARVLRAFAWGDFLPVGGAVLIGEARTRHGMRLYLYEMPG